MKSLCRTTILLLALTLSLALSSCGAIKFAEKGSLKVPSIFSSQMLLQRDKPVVVWGWASAGSQVTVSFAGQSEKATTNKAGRWDIKLKSLKASAKGRDFVISSGDQKLNLKDVLVGEVWVASGQSNMQWGLKLSSMPKPELAKLNKPLIRIITFPKVANSSPQKNIQARWTTINPKSAPNSSAVATYFAMNLQKELNVPIGIVSTSWGGTRIEPWTPVEGFEAVKSEKSFSKIIKQIKARALLKPAQNMRKAGRHQRASALYNAMIHPFKGLSFKGAIWYQGESNMGEGLLYEKKMQALVKGWRKVLGQGDFPFYHVQLAPFNYRKDKDGAKLAGIWEAQHHSIKSIKNTGMAVITDIGALKNIHPTNKKDVGHRLALWALAKDYGRKVVFSGPLYKGYKVKGKTIVISFDYAKSGLSFKGKELTDIYVSSDGTKDFVKAKVKIKGKKLIVSHPNGKKPAHVRMGWNKNAQPNLMNKEGLPASPFRTDK